MAVRTQIFSGLAVAVTPFGETTLTSPCRHTHEARSWQIELGANSEKRTSRTSNQLGIEEQCPLQ